MVEIRAEERRAVAGAFLTLLCVMCGHALVETARDALFLTTIEPQRLPLVYLAIAGLALLVNRAHEKLLRRVCHRSFMVGNLLLTTLGVLVFWWLVGEGSKAAIYALYTWSGVATMLIVVRFWTSLADRFTATEAKRLFAPIGAGSVSGAILGSAIARAITQSGDLRQLLLAAAVSYLAGSAIAAVSTFRATEECTPDTATRTDLRLVFRQPYVVRLLGWMIVATATFTLADFLFKWVVADQVAPERLGSFIANCYLAFHLLSLLLQITLVSLLVRTWGLHRVLGLPALLLTFASVVTLGILFSAPMLLVACAVGIKGIDGALRHSLHRTSTEMLFVPLSREVRNRSKAFLEVAGQRGGQAISSLLILMLVATPWPLASLAAGLLVLGCAWIAFAYHLRDHYLDLFRNALRSRNFETSIEYPSLDLASLESLIETLNNPDDSMVLAALELLKEQDRVRLIPALILYHPSISVAVRALDLFATADRQDVRPVARRLLEHDDPRVRAAALRTLSVIDRDADLPMDRFLDDESPSVRATALITVTASDWLDAEEAKRALGSFAGSADGEERLALAEAIAQRPQPMFLDALALLAADPDDDVARASARALRRLADPAGLPLLLPMLARRRLREDARRAIQALEPSVSAQLAEALADQKTPIEVRRHLPRTLMRFPPEEAAEPLLLQLTRDDDGATRYKIIRALENLRARHPMLRLNREHLETAIRRTMTGAFRLIDWQNHLERGSRRRAERWTPVAELLAHTLRHKRQHSIDRLFHLLGLLYPEEDFRRMHDGLRSSQPARRSSSIELLEATLRSPLKEHVVALVDDRSDSGRVLAGSALHTPMRGPYRELLRSLLVDGGMALRSLAAYHAGELRLEELRDELANQRDSANDFVRSAIERALAQLDGEHRGVANE